mgnify:CR=1 FL=1
MGQGFREKIKKKANVKDVKMDDEEMVSQR